MEQQLAEASTGRGGRVWLLPSSECYGGGGSVNTEVLYFKAPSATTPVTTLVNARVNSWDADLTRLLITETGFVSTNYGHYLSAVK